MATTNRGAVKAYAWFSVAAYLGNPFGEKNRAVVAEGLPENLIAEAESLKEELMSQLNVIGYLSREQEWLENQH